MNLTNKRILREQESIEKMIAIYCKGTHQSHGRLCEECASLSAYAKERLARCVFRESKPVCAKCTVHCYQENMRNKIIQVMRYAGPRMIYKHPLLAILHLIDSFNSNPRSLSK
jgi:hypothetical protein